MSAPRIKDATFIQLHIEKLILAFGVLVFLIGVFLFIFGNPFAIELNRQTYEDPRDAVDVLIRSDQRLLTGLQNTAPLPAIETPEFREDFVAMIGETIDFDRPLAPVSNPGLTTGTLIPDIPEPSRYALAYPPVPKNIAYVSGPDVLDKEFDPAVTQRFFDLWDKDLSEPGDFTMFIAAGEFDIFEWVSRLQAEVETDDESIRIPPGIWLQRFGIAGTLLLREEWDPETSRWIDRKIVVPLPGQFRVLEDESAPTDTAQALAQIAKLREGQIELAQPDLPWLTGFVQAVAPGDASVGEGIDGFLQNIDDENLGPREQEIVKLEEQIQQLEERRRRQNERRPGGQADPIGPGEPGAPRAGGNTDRGDRIQRNIDNLRERIERLRPQAERERENRARLLEERRLREEERRRRDELRAARDDRVFGRNDSPTAQADLAGIDLKEGSTLRVWAADPSMQPGKTYQYKLLVSVINPLYAVPRLAPDQLEENKARAALLPTQAEIEAMPWIGPISVEPESRFFYTAGRENNASIDIYRRHNGQLLYQDFDGSPGDPIGSVIEVEDDLGQVQRVDMSVGAVLVDVKRYRDALSNDFINTMVYMDAEGNIYERIESLDESSPDRKEALDEFQDGAEKVLRPKAGDRPGDNAVPDFGRPERERF